MHCSGLNGVPTKRYVCIPNSGAWEWDRICNDVKDLKTRSSWNTLVSPRFTSVFGRDTQKETDTQETEEKAT